MLSAFVIASLNGDFIVEFASISYIDTTRR